MTYEEAKTALHTVLSLHLAGEMASSEAWVGDHVNVCRDDISAAATELFPDKTCSDGSTDSIKTGHHTAISLAALEVVIEIMDQIDPETAPGKLFISDKLRESVKEKRHD